MYTISKAPSKLVATKSRRGLPQNYEKFETIRELNKKNSESDFSDEISIPKPVFQTTRKSLSYLKNQQQQHHQNHEILSPQHEELVKYMNECSTCSLSSTSSSGSSIYYVDQPSPSLNDFKPFDLESWWGRRLYQNITKSL
ncbi:unnamed protein product [Diamesa serratosioi]